MPIEGPPGAAGRRSVPATLARDESTSLADLESRVTAEWQVGDVLLDTYEVAAVLGAGGMGRVYRVHHRGWNVDLAVKSPLPEALARAGGLASFLREAETWVNLGLHPNVVSCHYVRTLGGIPRLFAEYLEGGSLSDWIHDGRLYAGGPEEARGRILDVALQFAWGLAYAHEQGLVHQDVKPANVMMTAEGEAKVTDFGLARASPRFAAGGDDPAGRDARVSVTGWTPPYCSPEQGRRERVSAATDVWSWAVSLLEMFTGGVTWGTGQAAPLALAAIQDDAENAGLPPLTRPIRMLLEACFDPDASRRPQTHELADRLRALGPSARAQPSAAALNADSLNNRALSLLDLGRSEEALASWEQALVVNPRHLPTHYNRGLWRWRRGTATDDELAKQMEELAATHPDPAEAALMLASVQLERGRADKALASLQAAATASLEAARLLAQTRPRQSRSCRPLVEHIPPHLRGLDAFRRRFLRQSSPWAVAVDRKWRSAVTLWVEPGDPTAADPSPEVRPGTAKIEIWDPWTLERRHARRWSMGIPERALSGMVQADPGGRPLSERLKLHSPAVALSPDADVALTALGLANAIECNLWHTGRGTRETTFAVEHAQVWQLGPQGRYALGARNHYEEEGRRLELTLYDTRNGRRGCSWNLRGIPGDATSPLGEAPIVRLVPGESCLQTIEGGSKLEVLAIAEGVDTMPARTGLIEGHGSRITDFDLTPDGRLLLLGCENGTIGLWALPEMRCLTSFDIGAKPWQLRLSPDGRRAICGTGGLAVWDLTSQRQIGEVPGYIADMEQVSEDGGVAVCIKDPGEHHSIGIVRLYETATGRCLTTFRDEIGSRSRLSPDGRRLVVGTEVGFRLWSTDWEPFRAPDRLCRAASGSALVERHAAFAQAIRRAADARSRGDRAGWLEAARFARALPGHEQDPRVHEHWRALSRCVRRRSLAPGWEAARIEDVWESLESSPANQGRKPGRAADTVDLSGDGTRVAAARQDGALLVWDVASRSLVATLTPDTRAGGKQVGAEAVALDFEGQRILSGHADGSLRLWEIGSEKPLATLKGHSHPVKALQVSPDGRIALSTDQNRERRVWDLPRGRCLQVLAGYARETDAMQISEDGLTAIWLATRFRMETRNLSSFEVRREFEQGEDRGMIVSFSASPGRGRLVASTSTGLVTWDLGSGECLATHRAPMLDSMQLTTCGRYALGCAADRLQVVDLTSGALLQRAAGRDGTAVAPPLRLSQDGCIAVVRVGRALGIWAFDWELDADAPATWHDGARPYLAEFLRARRPWAPGGELARVGKPAWEEADLERLLYTLGSAGYGGLRSETVRRELERLMTGA